MMGIPKKNIKKYFNASYDELEDHKKKLIHTILVNTKALVANTGILGNGWYLNGLKWARVKINAMKEDASTTHLEIDLDQ